MTFSLYNIKPFLRTLLITILALLSTTTLAHQNNEENLVAGIYLAPFADGEYWYLANDLEYEIDTTGEVVTVPRGFVTDFTSIPRPFWSLLPRWGKYGVPAIVHDWLYWDQSCTREEADKILFLAMKENKIGAIREWAIYKALRIGGKIAWKGNKKRKKSGDRKLLEIIELDELQSFPNTFWNKYSKGFAPKTHIPSTRQSYCEGITD